jgi:hypothetical protein
MPVLGADSALPAAAMPAGVAPLTVPPPAPIGLSVGFGAPASDASGFKP